jgi:RIO-like serine/threonine protein kinase
VLYKCPHCLAEGKTEGRGIELVCKSCGKRYELCVDGSMEALDGVTEFSHVPDWYRWERECVRKEIVDGTYKLDVEVDVFAMVDTDCIYDVGEGRLVHDLNGFHLTGCDGQLDYIHKPLASYSLYADYYWYKLGDMICIGDKKVLYYCFPKNCGDVVAKTRLAAEELYKIVRAEKRTVKKDDQ